MLGNFGLTAGVTPISSGSASPSGQRERSTASMPLRRLECRTPICGADSIM